MQFNKNAKIIVIKLEFYKNTSQLDYFIPKILILPLKQLNFEDNYPH